MTSLMWVCARVRATAWDIEILWVSSSDEAPEAALWDTSHRQAAPLLATQMVWTTEGVLSSCVMGMLNEFRVFEVEEKDGGGRSGLEGLGADDGEGEEEEVGAQLLMLVEEVEEEEEEEKENQLLALVEVEVEGRENQLLA
ncbi:hypothetical protein INR49_013785 [Caranx melampygus]|nr:hypothetical protein INR49_013785 [Caranx melampygus]